MIHKLENIEMLPSEDKVRQISQSLAMLDAILMPEWEYRYFSFNTNWDTDEMMASMRNGSGDEYFIVFYRFGTIGKVFIKNMESTEENKKELFKKIPKQFLGFITEEAFSMDNISFSFWSENKKIWSSLPIKNNLPYLNFLTGDPQIYKDWADEYYEQDIEISEIKKILNFHPITNEIIQKLNPELTLNNLLDDIKEIGYPV